ncbi:hypothetical protein [Dongia sp.]|uniref:hypothetical protein n=1 Tax=Dongia sp. TaxID=1977262 RepID=UPI0035B23ADF
MAAMNDKIGLAERVAHYEALSQRAQGSNVNEKTLLATDYLNHVNEIVMLLELVPDAPECLEDCRAWQPLSYVDHFRQSGIADRDLAIEAYPWSPPQYKGPFDQLVSEMNRLVDISVARLALLLEGGNEEQIRLVATRASQNLQDLIGQASAVIHGDRNVIDQAKIDELMQL